MTFINNTYYNANNTIVFPMGTTFEQWQYVASQRRNLVVLAPKAGVCVCVCRAEGKDVDSIIADPLFTNPQANDFSYVCACHVVLDAWCLTRSD